MTPTIGLLPGPHRCGRRLGSLAVVAASVVAAAGTAPAAGAPATSRQRAQYQVGIHRDFSNCSRPNVAPTCSTTSDVDPRTGSMTVAASVDQPGPSAAVGPATYERNCDTRCESFHGERVTGTAEPGMPVLVAEGTSVLDRLQTDATGRWVAYLSLAPGSHTIRATAEGPEGTTASVPRTFSVVG